MPSIRKSAYIVILIAAIALLPTVVFAQSYHEDWIDLKGWEIYGGWWGRVGKLELSDSVFKSPPYSLHIESDLAEATYLFREIPAIDFDKPYKVSIWIYLEENCDHIGVYQDKNFRLVIIDNALKVHERRVEKVYKHVVNLEKETWYNIVAVADPREKTVTVTVNGVTVTANFLEPPPETSVTDNKGKIRKWDVILGDLSHNTGKGAIYIDDLTIAQIVTAFDFSVAVKQGDKYVYEAEVEEGGSVTFTIEVSLIRGEPRPVTLSVSGLPNDASYSLNPVVVTPPGTSILTIKAGSTTGVFSVDVKGSGDGRESIVHLTLRIKEKEEAKGLPSLCPQLAITLIIPAALIAFYHKNK